ncbi:MAG: methyl-accepting chemotaxis protein [Gammaproteobacteria bacterium]|nr:methyl-accepting chemotaxis protein [Gammaproteobacteria bacterium]MCW9005358.1 methyl-accepting chemotaxis protein [Gammaproteobacteria bacterium]MCW9057093.1 methyl-accepting chemotaxis protein [Gammaproteobacteria bacterium]
MKNIGLIKGFFILTGLLTAMLITQSAITYSKSTEIIHLTHKLTDIELHVLNKAHQLKLTVVQVQQWLTDISATRGRDGLNDGFDEAENNAQKFKSLIADLISLDGKNKEHYESMLPVFDAYYSTGKQMAQAYIDNGPEGGNRMMTAFDSVAADMTESVDAFLAATMNRISNESIQQAKDVDTARTLIVASSALILTIMAIFVFLTHRSLSRLPKAISCIQKIAAGDLSISLNPVKHDEIGNLLRAVDDLRLQILNIISQIRQTSGQLSATSQHLTGVVSETHDITSQQQSETQQVATAMNQMTASIQEVANNIHMAAETAANTNNETTSGRKVVSQAIQQIHQLANELENADATIQQLEQNSNSITGILDVIKGVAEQTNLLALNAAIEAARAGEQGRGFAVVADEVRSLASRTQQSTEEINQMIDKLLAGARQSVEVTNTCRQQAQSAVEQTSTVNASLETIANSVSQINDMSMQIANAAEEQGAVSEEINRNIVKISDMSEHTVEIVSQLTSTGNELNHQASELENAVRHFKL